MTTFLSRCTFEIMIHEIKITSINTQNQQKTITHIIRQNASMHSNLNITRVIWSKRVKISFDKKYSSLIMKIYNSTTTNRLNIDRSSLSRFDISRRLIHASYRQFYIHEKFESLRIKIKSNRSRFANHSNAKSFKCVTTLSKTRKEKEKKMMMKDEKNRLWFIQKFDDQRELLQQIVLHQSFDDRFEFFARMRHDVIIVDVDVFK
jgi:hypothetical protein